MRNRFPGICYRCSKPVAKGEGHFERIPGPIKWRLQHADCAIKFRKLKQKQDKNFKED